MSQSAKYLILSLIAAALVVGSAWLMPMSVVLHNGRLTLAIWMLVVGAAILGWLAAELERKK
jgi:hypothetical protein